MTYTAAGLVVLTLAALLLLVGVHDVWRHVWQDPKNGAAVNPGKTPSPAPRNPR